MASFLPSTPTSITDRSFTIIPVQSNTCRLTTSFPRQSLPQNYYRERRVELTVRSSLNNENPSHEEQRWLREEQRWIREEQRWLREEKRWEAERAALQQEILLLKSVLTQISSSGTNLRNSSGSLGLDAILTYTNAFNESLQEGSALVKTPALEVKIKDELVVEEKPLLEKKDVSPKVPLPPVKDEPVVPKKPSNEIAPSVKETVPLESKSTNSNPIITPGRRSLSAGAEGDDVKEMQVRRKMSTFSKSTQ